MMSLTVEADWLLQMHHGDVGLFGSAVVVLIEDDAIDLSGLNVPRVPVTLRMKSQNSRPELEVDVLPGKTEKTHVFMSLTRENACLHVLDM